MRKSYNDLKPRLWEIIRLITEIKIRQNSEQNIWLLMQSPSTFMNHKIAWFIRSDELKLANPTGKSQLTFWNFQHLHAANAIARGKKNNCDKLCPAWLWTFFVQQNFNFMAFLWHKKAMHVIDWIQSSVKISNKKKEK